MGSYRMQKDLLRAGSLRKTGEHRFARRGYTAIMYHFAPSEDPEVPGLLSALGRIEIHSEYTLWAVDAQITKTQTSRFYVVERTAKDAKKTFTQFFDWNGCPVAQVLPASEQERQEVLLDCWKHPEIVI